MTVFKVIRGDESLEAGWSEPSAPSAAELFGLAGLPRKGPGRPLAARLGTRTIDLSAKIDDPTAPVVPVTAADPDSLELLRHGVSHVMAEAVVRLFPEVKAAIGPAIENGFYYDFDRPQPFTPEDLVRVSTVMEEIVKEAQPFERSELKATEALAFFKEKGEIYKVELIEGLIAAGAETVSLYRCGDFVDLCRGPHMADTSFGGAFKLTSVAGAYWRGDEKRPMLQRIYGTVFHTPKDLKAHLALLEEAARRDHRKLGRELDLFSFHEEVGGGLAIWHPKGALLRTILEEFERREHLRRGYEVVMGPQILRADLWRKSGHLDYYSENMYFTEIDGQSYAIKPMNCLAHMLVYKSRIRSFRDLPLRLFELGTVQRHEKSGVLHGLTRVRQFTQDDSHIFSAPQDVGEEIVKILRLVSDMMGAFGFEYEMELSTRPEKSIGDDDEWEMATEALRGALTNLGVPYEINEGDGAFYGPKIDVKLKDALGRRWQCGTVQCDFTLPERFDLTYVDSDNQKKRPVMLHRTIFGSLERFIGILTEHYAGAFPAWLAPVQAILLTVTSRADETARDFTAKLKKRDFRVETDLRNEKLGFKIREASMAKIPYILVIGDEEIRTGTATVRSGGKDLGAMTLETFAETTAPQVARPSWD
jgi:threonyl-tRNA synthetase